MGKLTQAAQDQDIDNQESPYNNQPLDIQQAKGSQHQIEPDERPGGSRLSRLSRPAAHFYDALPQTDILDQRKHQSRIGQPAKGLF